MKPFYHSLSLSTAGKEGTMEPSPSSGNPEQYSIAFFNLTRIQLPEQEAQNHWRNIIRHAERMSLELGRKIGFVTAACDYLVYHEAILHDPVFIPSSLLREKEDSIIRDDLTGLYNRRYFNRELPIEIERFARFGAAFSLLMVDIDHFKQFNDAYGHAAGDAAIKTTADIINRNARLYDRVVRYGGEEFTVILPQTTKDEALVVAERIRQEVQRSRVSFAGKMLGALTVSVGVSCFPADSLDMNQLVHFADQALYAAKVDRNKVAAYKDTKRFYPRMELQAPLNVLNWADGDYSLLGVAKNISVGGLLCESISAGPYDSPITISIGDGEKMKRMDIPANVVRVNSIGHNKYHLGISFHIDNEKAKKDLSMMLISLAGQEHQTAH